MLELVGRRHADEQEIGLVRLDDVLEHREVRPRPVEALLDVRLLGDDARLEDREVGGGRRPELLREVLGEVAGEAGLARPVRPGRERAADGRVEQADAGQVAGQLLDLDEHAGGQPADAPPSIFTLTSAHSPSRRMPTESAALFVLEKSTRL